MAKTKAKRLLSLLLSLAMVFSLTVAPVYATDSSGDTSSGAETTETGETAQETDPADSSGEDSSAEADASEEEETEEADETEVDDGISVASDGDDSSSSSTDTTTATTYVASIGDTQYESLATAINEVSSGQTVTLLSNVTLTEALKIYKSITLDLGNYTITSSASDEAIYTTQSLTIKAENGGITATNGTAIINQKGQGTGTLTINGGTYTSSASNAIYNNNGTVIVNSGSITSTATSNDGICCYANATVIVNGGTISGTRYGIASLYALTVTGGCIEGTVYTEGKAGVKLTGGTATISGGTIKGYEGLKDAGATSITITDGTFVGTTHAVNVSSSVTVSGGTFTATGTKAQYAVAFYLSGATVTFSGGTFSGMYSAAWVNSTYGGTIQYATGYGVVDGDGNTGVTLTDNNSSETAMVRYVKLVSPVATITVDDTTTKYATIAAAIEAAGETDTTITLVANTAEDVVIPANATITLDLNGYTLTNSTSHTITNNGTLTITDSSTGTVGTVDNVTHARAAVYNEVGATCTILSGSYTRSAEAGSSSASNGGNSYYTILNHGTMTIGSNAENNTNSSISVSNNGIYSSMIENGWQSGAQNTTGAASTLTIYGGAFTGGLYNVKNDDYGVLYIYGGTFSGRNNILNWNEAAIYGGDFTSTNMGVYTAYSDDTMDKGTTTIEGGTFTTSGKVINTYNTGVTYSITGGSYSDNSADDYLTGTSYQLAYKDNDGTTLDYKIVSVIVGKNINLSEGTIILNVYVKNTDSATVTTTESITGSLEDDSDSTRTSVSSNSNTSIEADYVLSQCVDSRMMTNTLTVKVTLSDGYVVTYETSVRDYAIAAMESEKTTTEEKAVLKAMLNYGAAAQKYNSYKVGEDDTLANEGYEYSDSDNVLKSATEMKAAGAKLTASTGTGYNGVKLSSMNLNIDYDFTVNLVFSAELTSDNLVSVSLNGTTLTENEQYTVSDKTISISGLSAGDLDNRITIETKDTDGVTKKTYLPGLYYAYLLTGQSNTNSQFLGQTIYAYSKAVVALKSAD